MSKKSDDTLEKMEASLKCLEISQRKTDYNETLPINQLPIEVFCMIFSYLDLGDLFHTESTCKKWSYIVKSFFGQKLVISKTGKLKPRQWFFLDELCPPKSVMVTGTLEIELIKSSFMFNLKQLKICDPVNDEYAYKQVPLGNLNFVNQFTNLEILEASQLHRGYIEDAQPTMKLPKLKHLAVNHFSFKLLLNCPKLVSLKIKYDEYYIGCSYIAVDFQRPLSVAHLYLDVYVARKYHGFQKNLEKLRKLEYLSLSGFRIYVSGHEQTEAEVYVRKIFKSFPNLKEISLRPDSSAHCMARETFLQLLKERKVMGKDLALTLYGIRIETADQLEHQPGYRDQSYGKFLYFLSGLYMKNHTKLCQKELKWTRRLSYSGLLNYSGNDKADVVFDLARKLDHVEEIRVSDRVPDEDQLIDFLNGLKRFQTLKIEKEAQLGASFYRKLAATCSKPWLTIQLEPQNGFTNFDFIFEFKNLVGFKTSGYDAGDDFVRKLFDHFCVFQFEYKVKKDQVKITKKSNFRFELSVLKGHCEVYNNLDELLQIIDKHCRPFYDPNHRCDYLCSTNYCPQNGYAGNIRNELRNDRYHIWT